MQKLRTSFLVLLCLSIFSILIVKFIWVNKPEFWKYGVETGEIVFNLSVAYIAAFIFYFIDVWIPKRDEQLKINDRLSLPLRRILGNMRKPLLTIYNAHYQEDISFDSITEDVNKIAVSKIDLINDDAPMIIWPQNKPANYGQYLYHHIDKVNENIEKIFKLPVTLDIELIEILDEIEVSSYHESLIAVYKLSNFKKDNIQMKGESIEAEAYKYYLLYFKLKKYIEYNQIIKD